MPDENTEVPLSHATWEATQASATISIAISLKRIADFLTGTVEEKALSDVLDDLSHNHAHRMRQ